MAVGYQPSALEKKALVLEDEKELGEALSSYLNNNGFQSVWCDSAEKAGHRLRAESFDILICDIRLNSDRYGGLDFLNSWARPGMTLILMTGFGDYESVKRGIDLHVDAYLEKPFDFAELIKTIQNPRWKRQETLEDEVQIHAANLTPRELEVLKLLKQGLSNKEIAHHLGNSVKTTKTHLTSIYKKFNAKSRAQLISRLFSNQG